MKHFTTLLLPFFVLGIGLLSSQKASASHAVGGEIFYEYIGDSTGVAHQYILYLKLYRNNNGVGFGNTENVSIQSSCYGTQTQTLNISSGLNNYPLQNFRECVDSGLVTNPIRIYFYAGVITLPGVCSDFKFTYDICCRNSAINNLVSPASQNLYLESTLNNTFGPNSSPQILTEGSKAFCIGHQVNWSQYAIEKDGDSLFYELIQPLDGPNQPIQWAPGYSTLQPITSANGVTFDSRYGDFIFTPIQPEVDVIRIRVSEYRYDTLFATFLKIAHVERDVQIYVLASCPVTAPKITIWPADSISLDTANIACGTKRLTINLSGRVDCRSIAPDGTDFAIFNSLGNLIPIVAAGSDNCLANATNTIWLEFKDTISYNDNVYLVTRTGSDFNTLESLCGFALPEQDSLLMTITTCSTSIEQRELEAPKIRLYPNPASTIINLDLPPVGNVPYYIFDAKGLLVDEGIIQDQQSSINIRHFKDGLYFLRVPIGHTAEVLKFHKL